MKSRLLLAVLALSAAGCVESRYGIRAYDKAIGPLSTDTRRSLIARWGNPDSRDGDTWTWKVVQADGAEVKGDIMDMPLFQIGRLHEHTTSLCVTFGSDGYVQSTKMFDTAPGLATWSLNPFAD